MNFRASVIVIFLMFQFSFLMSSAQKHTENLKYLLQEKKEWNAIDFIHNENGKIPLLALEDAQIASVNLGFTNNAIFDSLASKYADLTRLPKVYNQNQQDLNLLNDDLKLFNVIILKTSEGITKQLTQFISELEKQKQVIVVHVGAGKGSFEINGFQSVCIQTIYDTPITASLIPQLIFGGLAKGQQATRLHYTVPEFVGINETDLDSIPIIIQQAILSKGTPGAVIAVIKDGNMIYNKAFGSPTYDRLRKTDIDDIFDMASVTKLAATTMMSMKLYDEGKLSVDSLVTKYIARTRQMPEKRTLKVKEVLLHQAGFYPYIKFYEQLKAGDTDTIFSAKYPTQLADNYYLKANYYQDVMWPEMLSDKLLTRGKYVYSDLSMYYMKEIVEKVSGKTLDQFTLDNFYKPLGMKTAGFLPRKRFLKEQIIPTTENDGWLRKMRVQGFVNDPGAAMLGGVSGHAGFFASANDMAILGQMWLNNGSYGGEKYIKAETMSYFTSNQSTVSRRGLGFDRKDPDSGKAYPSKLASNEVFGHTGYTGTAIWIDPKYNLVYVFLSNRVYPDDKNKSLNTLNIRGRIQDVIYRAILKAEKTKN